MQRITRIIHINYIFDLTCPRALAGPLPPVLVRIIGSSSPFPTREELKRLIKLDLLRKYSKVVQKSTNLSRKNLGLFLVAQNWFLDPITYSSQNLPPRSIVVVVQVGVEVNGKIVVEVE